MRRTTVLLDDGLADLVEYERRRRGASTTAIVREALTEYLGGSSGKRLPFVGLGRSGKRDTARQAEAILEREWGRSKGAARRARRR
jgi:hypothetical protein